jgi:hypothetical protein
MVEEIITALSRIRWLFVIARNSTFTYKGQAVDVKQVGRELGVRYILEGAVRKAGERIRITGQLIDAVTGTHLWADRFDGSLKEVLSAFVAIGAAHLVSRRFDEAVPKLILAVQEDPSALIEVARERLSIAGARGAVNEIRSSRNCAWDWRSRLNH